MINPRDIIDLFLLDGLTGGESDELGRFPLQPNVNIRSTEIRFYHHPFLFILTHAYISKYGNKTSFTYKISNQ